MSGVYSARQQYVPASVVSDASASSDAVPYPGGCEKIAPAYKKLIGLSLAQQFKRKAKELLGGVRQEHEHLGGINITQIGQANAKLHTVSSLPDARTMAAETRDTVFGEV